MEFFGKTNIPFLQARYYALALSLILITFSVYNWFTTPNNKKFGIDFMGGVEIIAAFEKPITIAEVREQLVKAGVRDATVQAFSSSESKTVTAYSICLKTDERQDFNKYIEAKLVEGIDNKVSLEKFDQVGPIIGGQIRQDALWATIFSVIGVAIYVGIRFEFRYAIAALLSLANNVVITVGAVIFTGREINSIILAALLTVVAYSINDVIVTFDRVREEILLENRNKRGLTFIEILNLSINRVLSRTIITTGSTLFVVLCLYFFGGGALSGLAFTLFVGFVVGVYSSIFVACPIVYWLEQWGNGSSAKLVKA